jgi:hypothetical protein
MTGYVTWIGTDSSVMKLSPTHITALNTQALANEHMKGSMYARNTLNFFYDSTYFTPPLLPAGVEEALRINNKPPDKPAPPVTPPPLLKLYPNPAKDYVMVDYNGFTNNSKIEVADVFGRIMIIQPANNSSQLVQINTQNFSSGMYFVMIDNNGIITEKGKFNIMR